MSKLTDMGIRKPRNMSWQAFFANNPDKYSQALNGMMDYTRNFDNRYGTNLTHLLWQQISTQMW